MIDIASTATTPTINPHNWAFMKVNSLSRYANLVSLLATLSPRGLSYVGVAIAHSLCVLPVGESHRSRTSIANHDFSNCLYYELENIIAY